MVDVIKKLAVAFDFTILPKSVWRNRSLLWQLVKRNVSMRYRGSMLGLLWSFVFPLMMLCVYTFVFSTVLQVRWGIATTLPPAAFAIMMFCGLSLFTIFSECVSGSCGVVTGNPNFVKKVIFPLEVLPLAQCISAFIFGIVWIVLLFFGVVFIYGKVSFTMLLLPLILLPLFLFSLGVASFVSSLSVYVKDTAYAVQVILQILFFMTPIFYPIEAVPERYRWPLELNPLTIMVEEARSVFLKAQLPDWNFLGIAFLVSLLAAHFGFIWFYKTKKGFADVL